MSASADWCQAPTPASAETLRRAGLPPWQADLLARRGVEDEAGARRFLRPRPEDLHDPLLLAGMEAAVERLLAAREKGEKVWIVGDYDVDGVTSTALLLAALRACGLEAEATLPHRMEEGYGFQPVHVERARAGGAGLILTADCGTTSGAAVAAARAAGLDVIVTDHHLPGDEPAGDAILINPHQAGCAYPFADLAAVGLALKLALALAARRGRDFDLDALLRVACLGTIADMVPLRGENRTIAALGLAALERPRSPGLLALMERASVRRPLTAGDVGFRLGPRINAAGRLASAETALELLLERDRRRAARLADQLERWNRERQAEEARVVEEARRQIEERDPLRPVLVAWSETWHRGVVGIAAGRLAREFHRPTVLLSLDGDGATGSGRSVAGIDLHAFLAPWRGDLERFGGHARAVGLTAPRQGLEELRRAWEQAAAAWPPELLRRRYEYELELAPESVSADLLAELETFEPHGEGNPRPLLRVGPLRLEGSRPFGKGHLRGRARGSAGATVSLLGWRWQRRAADLRGVFEVLAFAERDRYSGGPVLRLVDSRSVAAGGD